MFNSFQFPSQGHHLHQNLIKILHSILICTIKKIWVIQGIPAHAGSKAFDRPCTELRPKDQRGIWGNDPTGAVQPWPEQGFGGQLVREACTVQTNHAWNDRCKENQAIFFVGFKLYEFPILLGLKKLGGDLVLYIDHGHMMPMHCNCKTEQLCKIWSI